MSLRLPYKVKDFKSVQHNFDYLAGKVLNHVVKTVGPIQGDGLQVSNGLGQWRALTNLVLTYKPLVVTRARIDWDTRFDAGAALWVPVYTGLNVSPAPTSRQRSNAVVGAVPVALDADIAGLGFVHNGGPTADHRSYFELMLLAPGVTYTFQVLAAGGSSAGTSIWASNNAENWLVGTFWQE